MEAQKDYSEEHEVKRKEIWIGAWIGVANAVNCRYSSSATKWADEALKAFDERFEKPNSDN